MASDTIFKMNQQNIQDEQSDRRPGVSHIDQWWCDCDECELKCHESFAFQLELHRALEIAPTAWMVAMAEAEKLELHTNPQDAIRGAGTGHLAPYRPRLGEDGNFEY